MTTNNLYSLYKKIIILSLFLTLFSILGAKEQLHLHDLTILFSDKDRTFAQELLTKFYDIKSELNRKVGYYPQMKTILILTEDNREYNEIANKFNLNSKQTRGFAVPYQNLIILKNPRNMQSLDIFYKVFGHEYLHLLLQDSAGDNHIPLWFAEGFTQYFSGEWNFIKEYNFVKNILTGKMVNLNLYAYHYPKYQQQIDLFYQESYYAMKFLIDKYSLQKLQRFLENFRNYNSFSQAFTNTFQLSPEQFINQLERLMDRHSRLMVVYSGFSLIWIIIPLLLLIAYIRKRVKARRISKQWEEETL